MPWSDWEVPGDQIEICKRPDGSDWELGAGAFGKVRAACMAQHIPHSACRHRVHDVVPNPQGCRVRTAVTRG